MYAWKRVLRVWVSWSWDDRRLVVVWNSAAVLVVVVNKVVNGETKDLGAI